MTTNDERVAEDQLTLTAGLVWQIIHARCVEMQAASQVNEWRLYRTNGSKLVSGMSAGSAEPCYKASATGANNRLRLALVNLEHALPLSAESGTFRCAFSAAKNARPTKTSFKQASAPPAPSPHPFVSCPRTAPPGKSAVWMFT